jgi:hypothetical protein
MRVARKNKFTFRGESHSGEASRTLDGVDDSMNVTVDTTDLDALVTRIEAAVVRLEALPTPTPVVVPDPPIIVIPDPPVVIAPPPIVTPHAAFDRWAASPYCLRADSLRGATDYTAIANPKETAGVLSYDEIMDAMRLCPTTNQHPRLLLPKDKLVDDGTLIVVVQVYIPKEWGAEPPTFINALGVEEKTITVSKFFQICVPGPQHYLELRCNPMAGGICGGLKAYDDPGTRALGPGATTGPAYGAGSDCALPMVGPFQIYFDRKTTIVQSIDIKRVSAGVLSYDLYSLWTIDAERGEVQAYRDLPVLHKGPYSGVWVQDGGVHRRADPPLYRYWRNVLQLANAPVDEVLKSFAA